MAVDLSITPLGDIDLSENGDLKTTTNYNSSIIRRLSTTIPGYSRLVETREGFTVVDREYGSTLYNFLSSPMTEVSENELQTAVVDSLKYDLKVVILAVEREITSANSVSLKVTYRDQESGEILVANVGATGA